MEWFLLLISFIEILLLIVIVVLFIKLRRSEDLIQQLKQNHSDLMQKLEFNAQLEKELVSSFNERQEALRELDQQLRSREQDLKKLLQEADNFAKSPKFARKVILDGHARGASTEALAKKTGLSIEEVEWIIEQKAQ